jgi:hypothetical protein
MRILIHNKRVSLSPSLDKLHTKTSSRASTKLLRPSSNTGTQFGARCPKHFDEHNMPTDSSGKPGPKKENEQPKARKQPIFILLFNIELAIAGTILTLGVRNFASWYHDTRLKKRQNDVLFYTILLIATCAPTRVFAGMLIAAAYYYTKRKMHGEYKVLMRKQGWGYVMDPTDVEDKEKEDEAKKINAAIARKAKEEKREEEDSRERTVQPAINARACAYFRAHEHGSFMGLEYGCRHGNPARTD